MRGNLLGLFLPLFLYLIGLDSSSEASSSFGGKGDLGLALGSSAATKLVRTALDNVLRNPRPIEVELATADEPMFDAGHVDSRNRVALGSLELHFRNGQIEVEAQDVALNSTNFFHKLALPLLFLDEKRLLINAKVKRAYLRLSVQKSSNTLRVEQCEMESATDQQGLEMHLENSLILNALLQLAKGAMTSSSEDQRLRDGLCSLLLDTVVDLRRKYLIEIPFKALIPAKFLPYLLNQDVHLRSRLESVSAEQNHITVTATVEWSDNSMDSNALVSAAQVSSLLEKGKGTNESTFADGYGEHDSRSLKPSSQSSLQSDIAHPPDQQISERLMLWVEDTLLNELLGQFRWDFQWVNESIQLSSERLPKETRDFFGVICPQCFFLFNISALGRPMVTISVDNSITVMNKNRISAAVLNPSLGASGEKRTAIDLTLTLKMRMEPHIDQGVFKTHLQLLERKIEVMEGGSAFPSYLNKAVEQLLQDLIAEDIWPALQKELEPLIYQSGIQLPSRCGADPKSAMLHFEKGRFGVSAKLDLDEISFGHCMQQLKKGLPDTSKLLSNLPGNKQGKSVR